MTARYFPTVGRILIGGVFLMAGIGKLGGMEGFAQYMASGGVPAVLAWPSVLFEIALGLSLIAGWQVRIWALLGAAFCVVAGLLYHFQPDDPMQMISFSKNLAIAGGFLALAASGAGALALDRTRAVVTA